MKNTYLKSLFTGTAIALVITGPLSVTYAAAQTTGQGQFAVREDPDPSAIKAALEERVAKEAGALGALASELIETQQDRVACQRNVETRGVQADSHIPDLLNCFVDQAMSNHVHLGEAAEIVGNTTVILSDGSRQYAELAEAKQKEAAETQSQIDQLEADAAQASQRMQRVKDFVLANGQLQGDEYFEAKGLAEEWRHLKSREGHLKKMFDLRQKAYERFAKVSGVFQVAAKNTALVQSELQHRATEENFYVAQVNEAATVEMALVQTDHVITGVVRMTSSINAVRDAMHQSEGERLEASVTGESPATNLSPLFEDGGDQAALADFFRNFDGGVGQ
ncbi:hypothetical protein RXV86_21920 [Alisedimentitalea sp. MJ-SS2]|uniref:hypothetical protein n=1 Tax=Aliisedimentitalea sp. MJ-SS2 TaxID=3049795 RepID=UPI0029086E49|nr:hypothetical protein [Alisedimentitalea sp. MJ-SS2]MDU8930053.1 hypothetical protein [Alisedimentitalea sp. MJ-SS2]